MLNFNDSDIKRIFTLRSQGKSQRGIAKLMECSDNSIAKVLRREVHADVEIPENILNGCEKVKIVRKKRTTKKAKTCDVPSALAAYTAACHGMIEAKRDCVKLGLGEETLELIRVAVKDGV